VIEGFHIDIAMLHEHLGKSHTILIVGYPHISAEAKYGAIRAHDLPTAWTSPIDASELYTDIAWFLELSREYYTIAAYKKIPFIDTSFAHSQVIEGFLAHYPENIGGIVPRERLIGARGLMHVSLTGTPYKVWEDVVVSG
jgi:hypothetical protein